MPIDTGCPIMLDAGCVLYHKYNNEVSELDELNLTNGVTLEVVLEALNDKVKQINVTDFTLTYLREKPYVINTFQQFAQSVDTELSLLKDEIDDASSDNSTPLTANDSSTITFATSGTLNHTVSADIIISAANGNRLSVETDGLFSASQTLSVNNSTKELSISDGNTVDLSSISAGVSGYLGEVTTDPSLSINGQYWYNTVQSKLKMTVNGVTKEIVTA